MTMNITQIHHLITPSTTSPSSREKPNPYSNHDLYGVQITFFHY
jgi:hypothetical protein